MAGLPCPFARRSMLSFGQHFGIRRPKIRVQHTALVGGGNPLPPSRSASAATGGRWSRCGRRWHTRRSGGYGGTGPARPSACFCETERTTTLWVASAASRRVLAHHQSAPARASGSGAVDGSLFFSQAVTVPRLTPNVRARPRMDMRSW